MSQVAPSPCRIPPVAIPSFSTVKFTTIWNCGKPTPGRAVSFAQTVTRRSFSKVSGSRGRRSAAISMACLRSPFGTRRSGSYLLPGIALAKSRSTGRSAAAVSSLHPPWMLLRRYQVGQARFPRRVSLSTHCWVRSRTSVPYTKTRFPCRLLTMPMCGRAMPVSDRSSTGSSASQEQGGVVSRSTWRNMSSCSRMPFAYACAAMYPWR